jgi:hypothetical protein
MDALLTLGLLPTTALSLAGVPGLLDPAGSPVVVATGASSSPAHHAASGDRAHLTAPGGSESHTLGTVTGEGEGDQPSPESVDDCPTCHGWGRRRISASNSTTCETCGGSGVWEGGAL